MQCTVPLGLHFYARGDRRGIFKHQSSRTYHNLAALETVKPPAQIGNPVCGDLKSARAGHVAEKNSLSRQTQRPRIFEHRIRLQDSIRQTQAEKSGSRHLEYRIRSGRRHGDVENQRIVDGRHADMRQTLRNGKSGTGNEIPAHARDRGHGERRRPGRDVQPGSVLERHRRGQMSRVDRRLRDERATSIFHLPGITLRKRHFRAVQNKRRSVEPRIQRIFEMERRRIADRNGDAAQIVARVHEPNFKLAGQFPVGYAVFSGDESLAVIRPAVIHSEIQFSSARGREVCPGLIGAKSQSWNEAARGKTYFPRRFELKTVTSE